MSLHRARHRVSHKRNIADQGFALALDLFVMAGESLSHAAMPGAVTINVGRRARLHGRVAQSWRLAAHSLRRLVDVPGWGETVRADATQSGIHTAKSRSQIQIRLNFKFSGCVVRGLHASISPR